MSNVDMAALNKVHCILTQFFSKIVHILVTLASRAGQKKKICRLYNIHCLLFLNKAL